MCDALHAIPIEEFATKSKLTIVILDQPDDLSIRLGNFDEVFSKAYGLIFFYIYGHIIPFPKKDIPSDVMYEVIPSDDPIYWCVENKVFYRLL